MKMQRCPECGNVLTQEMLDVNMCWECGKILNESALDSETLQEIQEQAREINPWSDFRFLQHKLTTSNSFQEYKIVQHIGLVSGETVIGTGMIADTKAAFADAFGVASGSYSKKMKKAKEEAILDMIGESIDKGGNAIVGVNFNYITFAGSNMIGVSVVGTSVVIEEVE